MCVACNVSCEAQETQCMAALLRREFEALLTPCNVLTSECSNCCQPPPIQTGLLCCLLLQIVLRSRVGEEGYIIHKRKMQTKNAAKVACVASYTDETGAYYFPVEDLASQLSNFARKRRVDPNRNVKQGMCQDSKHREVS